MSATPVNPASTIASLAQAISTFAGGADLRGGAQATLDGLRAAADTYQVSWPAAAEAASAWQIEIASLWNQLISIATFVRSSTAPAPVNYYDRSALDRAVGQAMTPNLAATIAATQSQLQKRFDAIWNPPPNSWRATDPFAPYYLVRRPELALLGLMAQAEAWVALLTS